jgi:hypothetical protein
MGGDFIAFGHLPPNRIWNQFLIYLFINYYYYFVLIRVSNMVANMNRFGCFDELSVEHHHANCIS